MYYHVIMGNKTLLTTVACWTNILVLHMNIISLNDLTRYFHLYWIRHIVIFYTVLRIRQRRSCVLFQSLSCVCTLCWLVGNIRPRSFWKPRRWAWRMGSTCLCPTTPSTTAFPTTMCLTSPSKTAAGWGRLTMLCSPSLSPLSHCPSMRHSPLPRRTRKWCWMFSLSRCHEEWTTDTSLPPTHEFVCLSML